MGFPISVFMLSWLSGLMTAVRPDRPGAAWLAFAAAQATCFATAAWEAGCCESGSPPPLWCYRLRYASVAASVAYFTVRAVT